jgi:DNA-binding LytR/AlgR family response regulator
MSEGVIDVFKLKTTTKEWIDRLQLPASTTYEVVVTDDKAMIEDDKVNLVFPASQIHQVETLLPWLYHKQPVYLSGSNERGMTRVESQDIYMIESFGDEVYVLTKDTKLRTSERLYQIEEQLATKDFVRISKSVIVNLAKVRYIQPSINAKLKLELLNGQTIEVNRSYTKTFKQSMQL